jgi:carbon starvation protein
MFEALFILTTIDSGTRVARFLLQEFVGKAWKPFGRENWMPGAYLSTGLIVLAWGYLLWTGDITTIWPMFGTANQLPAVVALAVGTSAIINSGKFRYAWVTFIPMAFVATTTLTAGVLNITDTFWPMTRYAATAGTGWVNIGLSVIIMACAVIVIIEAFRKWGKVLIKGLPAYEAAALAHISEDRPAETRIFRCC